MRLPLVARKKSKKDRTIDTVASVAKAWGEWQLAKGAVKTAKGAPWKLIGAAAAGLAAVGLVAKKLTGRGGSTATPPPPPASTGPVPDPNAPGAAGRTTTPAPPRGPVDSSDAPGAGKTDQSGTTGASPAAPPAPTGPTPDLKAPEDK